MPGMHEEHELRGNDGHKPDMEEMMTKHMTFFWGTQSEILFSGWPGAGTGMYAFALAFVFALCILVEWISHSRLLLVPAKPGVAAGFRSLLHALRMGLVYLAMLAVMSFNGGVFLAAVAGHAVGFLVFARRESWKPAEVQTPSAVQTPSTGKATADLPPMSC